MSRSAFNPSLFPENARKEKDGTNWDRCQAVRAEAVVKNLKEMGIHVLETVHCSDKTSYTPDYNEYMAASKWVENPESDMVAIHHDGSNDVFHKAVEQSYSLDEVLKNAEKVATEKNEKNEDVRVNKEAER